MATVYQNGLRAGSFSRSFSRLSPPGSTAFTCAAVAD